MRRQYFFLTFLLLLGILGLGYFLGPRPHFQPLDPSPVAADLSLADLAGAVAAHENSEPLLKPGNGARIVWADSVRQTEFAVVYLHGFSASEREGGPLHEAFARRYGCNLYLARLPGHGLSGEDSFRDTEPQDWVAAAKTAIAYGKLLGKRVIVMGTSTGCTLALYLAAADPAIQSLFLYAPNIDLYDPKANLLNGPWGEQLAQRIFGGDFREWTANDSIKAYWTTRYRLRGLHALRELVSETMTPTTYAAVHQPTFITYYYENEENQDQVISVAAIEKMIPLLGIPPDSLRVIANPTARTHALACDLWNPNWQTVATDTYQFAEQVLGLVPVDSLVVQ